MTDVTARPEELGAPTYGGRILVTDSVDGRSRSAVAAVRALAAAGYRPVVTVSGGPSAAAASRACAGTLHTPRPGFPGYPELVHRELQAGNVQAVLPASDAVLVALDLPGAALVDKAVLPARAAAAGLSTPVTRQFPDLAGLRAAAGELAYPVVVKAALKSAAAAPLARRIDSAQDLAAMAWDQAGPLVVQPFLPGALRAVSGVVRAGRLVAVVHQHYVRTWPRDCGVASAAVTTAPDLRLEQRLPALLAGHDGVFQVQLVGDVVIDVNPRVYGSLPLAVAAGVNLPALAVGSDRDVAAPVLRGRPGVPYRWLEGDLRHLAAGVRAGAISPAAAARWLLPRRGTAHSIESLRDPGPLLSRLRYAAGRAR